MTEMIGYLYSLFALLVFCLCLKSFFQDRSTPKTDLTSWIVVLLATAFWPIVVPFAYFERIN